LSLRIQSFLATSKSGFAASFAEGLWLSIIQQKVSGSAAREA